MTSCKELTSEMVNCKNIEDDLDEMDAEVASAIRTLIPS